MAGKLKQILIAWIYNRLVDKLTQLLIFVNSVYLGSYRGEASSGFQEAARNLFNKEISRLTDDEYLSSVAIGSKNPGCPPAAFLGGGCTPGSRRLRLLGRFVRCQGWHYTQEPGSEP